ncbi:hypothetical protein BGZ63DRAFT_404783 [Mariannaea sp. PMI_226]|nr:hypothetical protein BGZ63DRAFT_404783 [Mariannaea sp. PMI_226]
MVAVAYQVLGLCLTSEEIKRWITGEGTTNEWERERVNPRGLPSIASVLAISAPSALLSASVHAFLVGFGVYLGFVWTSDLDKLASPSDSKAVFLTYVVSVGVCYSFYALSNVVAFGQNEESEFVLLRRLREREAAREDEDPRQYFRDAARIRRELVALDDRIAQHLEGIGQR